MDRKYDIQLNLSPYANIYEDGGLVGRPNGVQLIPIETKGISPSDAVNPNAGNEGGGNKFLDFMNNNGGGGWANAIAPAATNIANAFLDTEASTADRVAGALGIPALANQWRADTSKGDSYLKGMTSTLDSMSGKNYLQDASSTFGANNAVKLNNKQIISPISPASALPSLEDFKGNWWRNMGASVAQGAASGSVGGPWGALGGAVTGLFGSIGGLFGRAGRAQKAYDDFLAKRRTLMSAQQSAFNKAVKDQTLSNMQALANGNTQQRINDMANIRAYGGNLYPDGGELTDEQYAIIQDIEANPRKLFTPEYTQWRNWIRANYPKTIDRLYASLPYEQQLDIYQNDREAWGALSNEAKGRYGAEGSRRTMNEAGKYTGAAMGIVGMAPAMEAVTMFPMLENGINAYFGYESAKNLPTAVTDAYNYAKKGDWSRAGLSAGEAALDGMFIGNGIKGVKNIANGIKYTPNNNILNMPSNGNYIPSRNYFYSQIDNPSVAKYIAEVEGNPAFQTRPFSKFNSEDETLSYLRHNSLGRTRKYGTDSFSPEQVDEFDKAFNDYMKDYDYQTFDSQKWGKAGKEELAGFHDPENKYIAAVKDSKIPLKDIKRHEVRHAYDKYGDILSNKQHDILDNAYGSDFVDLPKNIAGNDPLKGYSNMHLEKTTTNLDARKALLKGREETASIDVQNMIIDKMTDDKIIEAVRNSNGYGKRYIEYLEKNNLLTPQKVQAFRDAMKYVGIGTGVGLITNNTEYAMGGNLYTDLSPNMMSLWNNKQQIDQQKTMNQQFSLGLGNSSFVNKFETGGPVDPPKEFMDVYHPDWGIYTPAYANMTFDEYKQKYGNPNDPDNFDYSPESYNSYQYRLYQPYPNSSTFGNSYLFRPEMSVLNKKYPIENLPVYRDKKGDLYLKRGIRDLYGNNDVYIDDNTEDPTYNRRNKNGDLRITPHKDEWELGHTDKSVPRESFEAFKKSSEEQLLNELRRRAYDNEFYSYPEVQKYNANNSKQKSSNATTKKTANNTTTKSSLEKKASSKATAKNTNNIDNMTYQQMEDYYGQKQSPLLNAQYKNTWATGGQMTSLDVPDNMQYFANGGTHEENPYGGIQVGTDQQGTPNLVEEGEFRWNDFVFSDRINVDANLLSSFNLAPATKHQNKKAAKGKLSYADMAKKYAKRNKELENDPITKNSMEAFMQRLANAQEYQKKAEQLEAQKQNELQDYKTALNKQNNNPMYGTMKYNGMGNAATQQGVNSGVNAGMDNPMSNADLSNVNRSGNEMMAAYGGNLFAIGGKDDPNPYEWTLDNLNTRQVLIPWNSNFIGPTLENSTNLGITPNADNYSWGNIDANTPFYQNEGWGIDMKPTYMKVKNPNYNAPAVSTYATRDKNGKIIYDPNGKPFMSYPRTYEGMKSSDYPNTKVIGKTVDNNGFYLNAPQYTPPAQGKVIQPEYEPDLSDYKAAYYKDFDSNGINTTPYIQDNIARGNNGISNIPITVSGINPTGVPSNSSSNIGDTNTAVTNPNNINTDSKIGKTTPNTNPDAAVPSDPKEAPLYSTAGKYAQFGKGIMPMIWDWANKTNVKYDPYQRDADRLEALANEGPSLRTADTIGGYRAPNLMDVERLNNSARAEGLAQMQAILDAANGNRGFVGAQSAQNNYNTQKGIGDNYVKAQEANNTERLQTDQFNHGINVANQNAINTMRQDNQRAEQTQHQLALSGTAQAAALRQKENLHADEVNTERMKNRAANQAAYVDNALNYFTTQAMENQELNTRNNDPTNPYWIDKEGRTHYVGDSGLTQAIRDEFGDDEYGRNGTFTGERLTEWNNLTKKYKAKDLKEHPELWRHLVAQQREANKIDAEKAKQARMEELEALRGTYQSNLARLNALRDSGAIISDPSYNLYTGWADEDYSRNQGLLRNRNQALDQYITQIGNNYDRYLYEKQLAQNQSKALGGYLDDRQNNNNYYYSYTRI